MKHTLISVFTLAVLGIASCSLEKIEEGGDIITPSITFDTTISTSEFGDAGVGVAQFKDGTYLIGAYGGKQILHLSKDGKVLNTFGGENAFWIHDFIYKPNQDEVVICGFQQPPGTTDFDGYIRVFKNGTTPDKETIITNGTITWIFNIVQSNSGDYTFLGQGNSGYFLGFADALLSPPPFFNPDYVIPYSGVQSNLIQTKAGNYIYTAYKNGENHVVKTKPNSLNNNQIEWTYLFDNFLPGGHIESNGNYCFAGFKNSKPYFLVLSSSKVVVNESQLGGGEEGGFSDIKPTSDGGYILAGNIKGGSTNGGSDFYLVKLRSNFTVEWEQHFGGALDEYSQAVTQASDNGYIIVGSSKSFGNGENDIYIVKTDSLGQVK